MKKTIRQRYPLAARLTFFIVLSSSVITFITISLLLYRQYTLDIDNLDNRLDFIETSTLPSLQNSLWEFNDAQVEAVLNGLLKLDDIISAEVHSLTWDLKPQIIRATDSIFRDNNIRSREYPIIRSNHKGDKNLGTLYVTASLDGVRSNLLEQAKIIIITQGIKTFVVTLLILMLIRFLLTRHLRTISHYAKNLKLDEEHQELVLNRSPTIFPDELDDVVNALNKAHTSFLEEKRYELKIEKQKSYLEASSRAKSIFLSHMSHEIRTPMNGVIGLLDLIDGENLNEEQKKYLHLIKQSGHSLLAIINDILDFSKIEAGKFTLVNKPFSLHEILAECISLYTASAMEKNLEVIEVIDLPFDGIVLGDPVRIKQILLNFLSNAFKYTEKGRIVLSAHLEHRIDKNKVMIKFSVADTGIGISEEFVHGVFNAFEQGDPLKNRQGTGLGLSISKKLVGFMDGEIGVNSKEGEGSEFWFTLPLTESDKKSLYSNPEVSNEVQYNFAHPVLIAEDNDINIQVISGMLNKLGIETEIVRNGKQAVEKIINDRNKYTVVFMDCEMPEMDGFEATKTIREFEKQQQLAPCFIISLSAHHTPQHLQKCLDHGMNDHLSKPITLNDIQQILDTLEQHKEE